MLHVGAQAAAPLNTDDPGILAAGDCELESYAARSRRGGLRSDGMSVQGGCGIGWSSQLNFAAFREQAQGGNVHGTALHAKTVLREAGSGTFAGLGDLSLTLGYGLALERNAGRWRRAGSGVSLLVAQRFWSNTQVLFNVGHARQRWSQSASTTWGLAIEQDAGPAVTLVAETYGDDRAPAAWAAGLRWRTAIEGLTIGGTYSASMERQKTRCLGLGATRAF